MQSIHNPSPLNEPNILLFAIYQRYEMQSIHNDPFGTFSLPGTVCDISKIRNVVNSQQKARSLVVAKNCLRYIKDTKCSQFTTHRRAHPLPAGLFAIYQRYEMQSIHNQSSLSHKTSKTVCDISKIRNVVNSQQTCEIPG